MKTAVEKYFLHTRVSEKLQCVFDQGRVGQREKTLDAQTLSVFLGTGTGTGSI